MLVKPTLIDDTVTLLDEEWHKLPELIPGWIVPLLSVCLDQGMMGILNLRMMRSTAFE